MFGNFFLAELKMTYKLISLRILPPPLFLHTSQNSPTPKSKAWVLGLNSLSSISQLPSHQNIGVSKASDFSQFLYIAVKLVFSS